MKPCPALFVTVCLLASACNAFRFDPPREMQQDASVYEIKGVNGWYVSRNKTIRIGDEFKAGAVRRGWKSTVSTRTRLRPGSVRPTNDLFFNMLERTNSTQRYSFNIQQSELINATFYGVENISTEQATALTGIFKDFSVAVSARYTYSGAFVFENEADSTENQWNMMIYSNSKEGGNWKDFLKEGFITNLTRTILIKPMVQTEVTKTKTGETVQVQSPFPFPLFLGIGFFANEKLIGYLSLVSQKTYKMWLKNNLDNETKTLLCGTSIAILVRVR